MVDNESQVQQVQRLNAAAGPFVISAANPRYFTVSYGTKSAAKGRESAGTVPTQSRLSRRGSAQACSASVTLH